MNSILSNEPVCFICGTPLGLHKHHIFSGNGRRQKSERWGAWVYLCGYHHNMSPAGVHNDRERDLWLRRIGQQAWEKEHGTREDFIREFGKSWL